jgi:hypothetical protein
MQIPTPPAVTPTDGEKGGLSVANGVPGREAVDDEVAGGGSRVLQA